MGRVLEFALTTFLITIVHVLFALYISVVVRNEIEGAFSALNKVLTNLLYCCKLNGGKR